VPSETIDYTTANWRDALKTLTGGNGPELIFDPIRWRSRVAGVSLYCLAAGGIS